MIISNNLLRIFSLSKTTRFLATIDIFFALIYSLYNFYFFIPFLIAFSGYYGAKFYNNCSILVYATYLFLINIARVSTIIFTIYYYNNNPNEDSSNIGPTIFFASIICLLNLWIAKFVCVFWNFVKNMTNEEKNLLIIAEKNRTLTPNYIWVV